METCTYKQIEPYYYPFDSIMESGRDLRTEMTREQCGFLCGLLRKYKPHKLVEVGVAAGGTTAIILNCLEALSLNTTAFSVDLNDNLYYEGTKKTGYIAEEYLKSKETLFQHEFMTGCFLPERLDEIGDGIDFVILDTVHRLPGEILDYLAVLPYLSDNAVVVLHDVSLQHNNSMSYPYCYATQILFSTVTAQKYLNNSVEYPNIAAFIVNEDTRKYTADVFSALTLTWDYYCFPDEREQDIYQSFFQRHYNNDLCALFDQALSLNRITYRNGNWVTNSYFEKIKDSLMSCYNHIILYGKGKRGQCLYKALCEEETTEFSSKLEFVVSDEEEANKEGCHAFEKLDYDKNDTLIILSADSDDIRSVLSSGEWRWLDIPEPIWHSIERLYG